MSVPDKAGRERILGIQTAKMPLADDVDLKDLAERTDRFSGADLEDLVRRAGLVALRQSLNVAQVTQAHFDEAMKDARASVTPEMETEYAQMASRLKQQASAIQPIGFISPGQLRPRATPLE